MIDAWSKALGQDRAEGLVSSMNEYFIRSQMNNGSANMATLGVV